MGISTSGYYNSRLLQQAAIAIGINYNTLRADISWFEANGWLNRHHRNLRLLKPNNQVLNLLTIFNNSKNQLEFCALVKKRLFFTGLYAQAKKEAENIHDTKIKAKYLRTVRGNNSPLGVKQGLFCSLGTVSTYFGKSISSAKRYLKDLKKRKLVQVIGNAKVIGEQKDFNQLKRMPELINRVFLSNGLVFLRQTNSYKF